MYLLSEQDTYLLCHSVIIWADESLSPDQVSKIEKKRLKISNGKIWFNLGYCKYINSCLVFDIVRNVGVFDPYKCPNTDMLKLHGMVYETLMEDEENQIRGYVHIVDCTGLNLPYMTLFTPKEAVRIIKNAEVYNHKIYISAKQTKTN